jgi:peptide-methionine (S)-S-oxide reductase
MNIFFRNVIAAILSCTLLWHAVGSAAAETPSAQDDQPAAAGRIEQATFGLGCFWCAEAVFEQLQGVTSVEPGYSGGRLKNPSYDDVSSGRSGHAEVVQITYDPKVISYDELLEVFWKMHDPTTLNRQGHDIGSQYRSVILYHSDEQGQLAKHYKQKLEASGVFADAIVTEITPFEAFYPAEKEHLDFYRLNPDNQYCRAVIQPKLAKLKKVFAEKLQPASATAGRSAAESGRSNIEFTKDSLVVVKKNLAEDKAVLVDVRSEQEWNRGHLKGSVFLPDTSLRKNVDPKYLAEKLPKDKIIYTFCVVGMRAKRVGKILEDHGYTVRVLEPGYDDLIKAGFKKG